MTATAPPRPSPPESEGLPRRAVNPQGGLPKLAGHRRVPGLELVLAALLPAIAALGLHPLYRSWAFVARPVVASALAGGLGLFLHRRQVSVLPSAAAYLVGGLFVTAYVSLNGTMPNGIPTGNTIDELSSALSGGWTDTLDAVLPVAVHSPTTTLAVAAAWVASVIAIELVVRSRTVLGPILPAVVYFGLTMPLTSSTDASTIVQAALLAGGGLLFVVVRSSPELVFERSPATQSPDAPPPGVVVSSRVRSGIPAVLLCAVLGPAIVAAAADPDRFDAFDPRDIRTEQVNLSQTINPLFQLRGFQETDPPTDVATVEYTDPADAGLVDRVAIVALDSYDGASWTSSGRFEQASSELRPDDITVDAAEVEQSITIIDIDDPWLPAARNPIEISSDDILYSAADGIMVRDLDFEDTAYTVTSLIPTPSAETLNQAETPADGDLARLAQLPAGVGQQFAPLAVDLMGEGTPIERLRALEAALQQLPTVSTATSGHSVGRLLDFLSTERAGLAEQHAAAFAVLARSQGIPTRLVVGLRTTRADETGLFTPVTDLTTQDYHVWPEVRFGSIGWVPFEPTPADTGQTQAPTEVSAPPVGGVVIEQQPTPEVEEPEQGDTTIDTPEERGRPIRTAIVLASIGLFFFALYAALVLGAKWLRRRSRRKRGTPAQRLVGAWRDSTDGLLESGVRTAPWMTLDDIASVAVSAVAQPDASAIRRLLPDVRRALYSTGEPGPEHIDRAWTNAESFRGELAARRTRVGRIRAALDPRPLFRR